MAGLTAAIMGTPADVVKTRVMNQPTKNGVGIYYKNSFDCLQKTVNNEGFWALYKGFLPIWMRLGPWSLTFWVTFEWIRGVMGVSSF
jgi:solute carrier family 25 uncoupling protein 27